MRKVDKAIEKLNAKGLKSSINWNQLKDSGVISIQNEPKGKLVNGVLSIKDQIVSIDIGVSNYNNKYLKSMLRDAFQQEGIAQIAILLKLPEEGNTILVENNMCKSLQPGKPNEIKLPGNTLYFAKNSHYVNCNGDYLGADFMARFIKQISGTCPDGDAQMFCEFLLLKRM